MQNFPYKHLIWAVVTVIALFLFKGAWIHLIMKMEEVEILDKVTIKVSQEDAKLLEQEKDKLHREIADLKSTVTSQQAQLTSLSKSADRLTDELKDCGGKEEEAVAFKASVDSMKSTNENVLRRSRVLFDKKVIQLKK